MRSILFNSSLIRGSQKRIEGWAFGFWNGGLVIRLEDLKRELKVNRPTAHWEWVIRELLRISKEN